ncbi:MAG TPA: PEGA domain-containing protein, partial [Polyangia bacterium]
GAAAPRSNAPISSQSTMMLDANQQAPAAGQRQMVVPTMMKEAPRQQLPPMQRPRSPSTAGRWIAGPILAVVVAAGTVFAANAVMPLHKKGAAEPAKPQGKLRLNSDPPGASILVDGKRFPHFTPTEVAGDIGSTLRLTFTMDGFKTQETEVYVAEGEHPFNVHLQPVAAAPTPAPAAPEPAKKEHHDHHAAAPKEPVGEASLSVLVRPWAIVFVDHQRLKQTPVQGYKLPSGKHVIELVNEGKNRREKIEVTLKPGEEQEIKRDWDR